MILEITQQILLLDNCTDANQNSGLSYIYLNNKYGRYEATDGFIYRFIEEPRLKELPESLGIKFPSRAIVDFESGALNTFDSTFITDQANHIVELNNRLKYPDLASYMNYNDNSLSPISFGIDLYELDKISSTIGGDNSLIMDCYASNHPIGLRDNTGLEIGFIMPMKIKDNDASNNS